MKAILIDVTAKTVTSVNIESGIDAIYEQLDCNCFDVVRLDEKNDVYVDDNGLSTKKDFFYIDGTHQPIRGNGLILGCNDEGESVDTTISVEDISQRLKFLNLAAVMELFS